MTLEANAAWRRAAAIILLGVPLMAGGCALTFDARSLGARTTLAERASEQPEGERFRISRKAVYALWGIAPMTRPELDAILASQITGASEIQNVRVTVKSSFVDILATVFTAGIIIPRTVVFEGVVVPPDSAGQTQ